MPEKTDIYTAMAAILSEVGTIAKTGKNTMQNYNFRGIEQVCERIQELFAKYGVFAVPEVLDYEREIVDRHKYDKETKQWNVVGKMYTTTSRIKYTFYAPDGSSVSAVTMGEGADFSDKASNKAMSAAMKYALVQTFCISEGQEESDTDTPTPKGKEDFF